MPRIFLAKFIIDERVAELRISSGTATLAVPDHRQVTAAAIATHHWRCSNGSAGYWPVVWYRGCNAALNEELFGMRIARTAQPNRGIFAEYLLNLAAAA